MTGLQSQNGKYRLTGFVLSRFVYGLVGLEEYLFTGQDIGERGNNFSRGKVKDKSKCDGYWQSWESLFENGEEEKSQAESLDKLVKSYFEYQLILRVLFI